MTIFSKKPYLLALFIFIALSLWLASGQLASNEHTNEAQQVSKNVAKTNIMQVQVAKKTALPFTQEIILTGRTAPFRTASLRSELDAKVVKIHVEKGSYVKKGQVIAQLAIDARELQVKEANALVKQRELEYSAVNKLSKKGYQSQTSIAEALTALESAKTVLKIAQLNLAHTKIIAPFGGVLTERFIEEGDYASINMPIADIIDINPLLIVGDLNEMERHQIKLGSQAKIRLVTGQTITGKVTLIATQAEANTRTFRVEISVPNPDKTFVSGMSAEIHIPTQTLAAHNVSSALLVLNDEGILGVKAVDDDNKVIFYPVEILKSSMKEGVWLAGLPQELRLITVGQNFVKTGEQVKPVE